LHIIVYLTDLKALQPHNFFNPFHYWKIFRITRASIGFKVSPIQTLNKNHHFTSFIDLYYDDFLCSIGNMVWNFIVVIIVIFIRFINPVLPCISSKSLAIGQ
jgi:hypothetical protein